MSHPKRKPMEVVKNTRWRFNNIYTTTSQCPIYGINSHFLNRTIFNTLPVYKFLIGTNQRYRKKITVNQSPIGKRDEQLSHGQQCQYQNWLLRVKVIITCSSWCRCDTKQSQSKCSDVKSIRTTPRPAFRFSHIHCSFTMSVVISVRGL